MNKYFVAGFICSLITFTITVILANMMYIYELNPIMDVFLNNTYATIIYYGVIWAILFTIYQYLVDTNQMIYENYLSYLVFFTFSFNLIHDIISLGVLI